MRRSLWSIALAATVSVCGVMAQTPDHAAVPADGSMLTVRGCIRRAVDIHTQNGSRLVSDPDTATQFVLVTTATRADVPVASAGGTSRRMGSSVRPLIYRLDDTSADRVSPHLGHEVEIAGTLVNEERRDLTPRASGGTPPKVTVNSLTMLASSCPRQP